MLKTERHFMLKTERHFKDSNEKIILALKIFVTINLSVRLRAVGVRPCPNPTSNLMYGTDGHILYRGQMDTYYRGTDGHNRKIVF